MGPKGPENRKKIHRQRIEAQEIVINQVETSFGEGKKLHTLVVGGEAWKRTAKDDERGRFRIGNWTRARTPSDDY